MLCDTFGLILTTGWEAPFLMALLLLDLGLDLDLLCSLGAITFLILGGCFLLGFEAACLGGCSLCCGGDCGLATTCG